MSFGRATANPHSAKTSAAGTSVYSLFGANGRSPTQQATRRAALSMTRVPVRDGPRSTPWGIAHHPRAFADQA